MTTDTFAQDFFTAIDLRARAMLSARIDNTGALMIDENHAYLDDDADIAAACAALQCSEDDLNDELFDAYQDAFEKAAVQIAEETKESNEYGDDYIVTTWQGHDGFYGCASGADNDGICWEGDDLGAFNTRDEAIDAVVAQIAECHR